MLEAVKIIRNAGASFLGSGQLVMKRHGTGSRFGGEGPIKSLPEVLGGFATKDVRQEFIRDGGHEHAQDQLILTEPKKIFWIGGDSESPIR